MIDPGANALLSKQARDGGGGQVASRSGRWSGASDRPKAGRAFPV